ncbi:MAG: thioredoxin family protein [Deltaproteobacteria bacterium]|jgi:thioredoxin-related protein|nr:thioredoxin family protein [Deltaproteobacteria bacterium]
MKKLLTASVLLILLATLSPAQAAASPADDLMAFWKPRGLVPVGYGEAITKAAADDKYIILYFWTSWCGNCEYFSNTVLIDENIVDSINEDFYFVLVDADVERVLTRKYKVRAVPTMVFLDRAGDPAAVLPGVFDPPDLALIFGYVSSGAYIELEFDQYLKKIADQTSAAPAAEDLDETDEIAENVSSAETNVLMADSREFLSSFGLQATKSIVPFYFTALLTLL